jgi:hypothetical protein
VNYTYQVNLNERGLFYASVLNERGDEVYTVRSNDDLDGTIDAVTDGWMEHAEDLHGLEAYLTYLGILQNGDSLIDASTSEEYEVPEVCIPSIK